MKKIITNAFLVIVTCFVLCACSTNVDITPSVYSKVKGTEISVEAENEFMIETYNVYLTNSNYEPTKTSILASEDVNTGYAKSHNCSSLDENNHIIESDIGKVHIVFELYMQIKYGTQTIPYTIHLSKSYYTKNHNNQIILYNDEKCTEEASFDFKAIDVRYNSGVVYNDSYKINLKIYVDEKEVTIK